MAGKIRKIHGIKLAPVEFLEGVGNSRGKPTIVKGSTGLICNCVLVPNNKVSMSFVDFNFVPNPGEYYGGTYATAPRDTKVRLLSPKEVMKLPKKTVNTLWERVPLRGCSLGTDPEIFVVDGRGGIIPAFDFLGKKQVGANVGPHPFWDGFQAEFTVNSGSCMAFLTDRVRASLLDLATRARGKNKKAKLSWRSVMDIPPEIMGRATDEQRDLGCAPSLNARDGVEPIQIDAPGAIPFRFAGCHLHFGIGEKSTKEMKRIVKAIDRMFGPVSTALFAGLEDPRRRLFYGKAGEYRTPSWGLEYRVPSSAMLMHPVLFHLCFEVVRSAIYVAMSKMEGYWDVPDGVAVNIINNYDVKSARRVLEKNKAMLKGIFLARFNNVSADRALELIEVGPREYFQDVFNIEKNWLKGKAWYVGSGKPNCCVYNIKDKKPLGIK